MVPGSHAHVLSAQPVTRGDPVIMLSFARGVAADAALEAGDVAPPDALRAIGVTLGAMHAVDVDAPPAAARRMRAPRLRAITEGGACDVCKHVSGEVLAKLEASEHTRDHPYVTRFYPPELARLRAALGAPGLARGVLHGDPFLDNVRSRRSSAIVVARFPRSREADTRRNRTAPRRNTNRRALPKTKTTPQCPADARNAPHASRVPAPPPLPERRSQPAPGLGMRAAVRCTVGACGSLVRERSQSPSPRSH